MESTIEIQTPSFFENKENNNKCDEDVIMEINTAATEEINNNESEQNEKEEIEEEESDEEEEEESEEERSDEEEENEEEESDVKENKEQTIKKKWTSFQTGEILIKKEKDQSFNVTQLQSQTSNGNEFFILKLQEENFLIIMYNVWKEKLKELTKEIEKAPWRQNFSKKPHWGVRLLNRHVSYLFSNDISFFNCYVSGYNTNHEANSVCVPATHIKKEEFPEHLNLQVLLDNLINQSTQMCFNEKNLSSNLQMKSNSLNGNLYGGSKNKQSSQSNLHLHQDGNATNNSPFGTFSWGKMAMLILEDRKNKTIYEIPNGNINSFIQTTLCIFIGNEFYKGNSIWHGKRLIGKFQKNEAHFSITVREMKNKVLDESKFSKEDPLPFGKIDFNDFTSFQIPTAQTIIGPVAKSDPNTNILLKYNNHLHSESQLQSKDFYIQGDKFIGGRRALAILTLSNQMRNSGIGGNLKLGNTDIFINGNNYPNKFVQDEHGWALIYYSSKKKDFKKEEKSGKVKLFQKSMENGTPTRIFMGPDCSFRQKKDKFTLYFADGFIVAIDWDDSEQNWRCMFRNHKCHKDSICSNFKDYCNIKKVINSISYKV